MKAHVVYKCSACHREYKTKREAENCYRSIESYGIKRDDLVMKDGICWKVLSVDHAGISLEMNADYVNLSGRDWLKKRGVLRAVHYPNINCNGDNYKKLSREDIVEHLKHRRVQVKCGEKLLEAIKEK